MKRSCCEHNWNYKYDFGTVYGWSVSIASVLQLWQRALGQDASHQELEFFLGVQEDPRPLHRICAARHLDVPADADFCLFASIGDDGGPRLKLRDCKGSSVSWTLCTGSWRQEADEDSVLLAVQKRRRCTSFYFRLLYMLEVNRPGPMGIRWRSSAQEQFPSSRRDSAGTGVCAEARCPDDLLLLIFAKARVRDISSIGLVCRRWNRLFLHDSVLAPHLITPGFSPW